MHKFVARSIVTVAVTALAMACGPASAAPNASEASGKVVDQDGAPLPGVVVVFAPTKAPETEYTAKTNKKGRYFLVGLYSMIGDEWSIRVESEGYVPTKMTVESRTVNRTLVRDIYEQKLKPGSDIPAVQIKPLGTAKIDFTLTPADLVALPVAPVASGALEQGGAAAPAAPQKKDPWADALVLANAGDLEGAAPYFEKAAEEKPEDVERQETLAKVLYQLERYDEAEAQARRSIELSPSSVGPRMVLYSTFVSRNDWERARTTLQEARGIAPDNVQILEQLAYVASETGETADAVAAYEALTGMDPENTDGWLALADAYATAGEIEKSEAAFQRAIDLDPANADQVFYNMGALMINKADRTDGETEQAITAFRKALQINPGYAAAHKQLAFALLGMGDRAGAKGELEAYLKLAPDAADATQMQRMIETLN